MHIDTVLAELNWRPADLARFLNISDGHVADIRSGRRFLSIKHAKKLAEHAQRPEVLQAAIERKMVA